MTRQEIIDKLKTSVCNVTFTKVNGEERTIPFTLQKDLIPTPTKDDSLTQDKVRNINESVIVAYAVDKKDWRSFRVANVKTVEVDVKYHDNTTT